MTEDDLVERIARAIELAIIRHGVPEADLEGTLDDATAILPLIREAEERGAKLGIEAAAKWLDAAGTTALDDCCGGALLIAADAVGSFDPAHIIRTARSGEAGARGEGSEGGEHGSDASA